MFTASLPLSVAPVDFSSAMRYNVTFRPTAFTDRDDPARTTVSSPIFSSIMDEDLFEGLEYFQARILETMSADYDMKENCIVLQRRLGMSLWLLYWKETLLSLSQCL